MPVEGNSMACMSVWYSNEENFAAFAGREAVSYDFSVKYGR
jgi:hypothetical protein